MRVLSVLTAVALVLGASLSTARGDTKEWTSLGPDGDNTFAITMDPQDSSNLYAATSAGIYKTVRRRQELESCEFAVDEPFGRQIVIDRQHPDTLYAATNAGVFKSTDAAASWQSANSGLPLFPLFALAISPQDSNTLYAGICCHSAGQPDRSEREDWGI